MGTYKARLVAALAVLLTGATVLLHVLAIVNPIDDIFALLGVTAAIAAATATACALIMGAAAKVITTVIQEHLADEAETWLRRRDF